MIVSCCRGYRHLCANVCYISECWLHFCDCPLSAIICLVVALKADLSRTVTAVALIEWVSIGKFLLLAICFFVVVFFNFLTKRTLSNHHAVVPNILRSREVSQLGAETKTRLSDLLGVATAPRKPQKAIWTRFFKHQTFIATFMIFPAGNLLVRCFKHVARSSAVRVELKISLLELKEILVSSATRVQHYF